MHAIMCMFFLGRFTDFFFNYYLQTKVTPIVEGYGGWAFRMEIVPIESAYPGFGDLVVSVV